MTKEPSNNSNNNSNNTINDSDEATRKAKFRAKVRKIVIWTLVVLLLIIIFVVIPLVCRNHFIETLKISEEIFLSSPQRINLVSSSETGPCYRIKINGYTFSVPNHFTPSRIDYNEAEFRVESRTEGRYIFIHSERRTKKINFNSQGITRWFIPTETRYFLPMILSSDWHPFRLMFKAQLFASEGITSKIFKARWDSRHVGYIFPTPRNEGYLGRIFNMNGQGTVDLLINDTVKPVTLREWVDLAMKMVTPSPAESEYMDQESNYSPEELKNEVEELIKLAENPDSQPKCLGRALNEFYRNQNPTWLIPVATVMQCRGFFPDVLDLFQSSIVQSYMREAPKYYSKMWNSLVDEAVADSVSIDLAPLLNLRELNVYCKNLTDLDIKQVRIKIDVLSNLGITKSFTTPLFSHQNLRNHMEKQIRVKCPADISLADAVRITHRVERLEFTE